MGYTAGISRGGSSFQSPEVHACPGSPRAASRKPGEKFQGVSSRLPPFRQLSWQWAPHRLPPLGETQRLIAGGVPQV